ncbi:AsmA family protein [Pseudodesulfovibrio sp.]|uniref:AsmA family protein n=1 Tax=Pseudodesulfovibrio sp. TaxID=2035812 RepID=UPI00260BD661|nr:AsmA family protein [Pseudodesulfovibrio sp.]MDD3310707.1 AsmA family protein [Pseudodesulfovibrio sp.]
MMRRLLRRLAILFFEFMAVAIVLCAVFLFWASRYVDTESFRGRFATVVEELTGQPVRLRGELNIALYPTLSLEVHDLSLMERPEAGEAPLVNFNHLFVSVRLLPLAYNRLEIRSVVVNGMRLNLARLSETEYNWHPLPAPVPESEGAATDYFDSVALDGLEVSNATIAYSDLVSGQKLRLDGITLHTGNIVPRKPVPFSAESVFRWKNGGVRSRLTLKGLVEEGEAGNILLKDASVYATFEGPFLPKGASPAEVAARIQYDWDKRIVSLENFHVQFLGLSGEGSVRSGDLGQGFSGGGHLTLHPFRPSTLIRRYFPDAPMDKVDGLREGAFTSFVEFDEKGVRLRDMAVALDDLTVRGSMSMADYSRPAFTFDLRADTLDLDRYLPLFMTDTPFVWGDFHLDAFRDFRGKGRVRANAFRVLGTTFSGVRADAQADGSTFFADAVAAQDALGALAGKVRFQLGREGETPTLGLSADLSVDSGKRGFGFPRFGDGRLSGPGKARLTVRVPPMRCPERERSIGILRHATLDAALDLGPGKAEYEPREGRRRGQTFTSAALDFKASPAASGRAGYFAFAVDGSLRGKGGAPFDSFQLSAVGPVRVNADTGEMDGDSLDVRAQLAGAVYTESSDQVTASGRVSFDTAAKTAGLVNGAVRLLDTSAKGDVRLDASGKSFKAAGKIEIPPANVHRIIYLLTRKRLELNDSAALKAAGVSVSFAASDTGFTLSDVRGVLDGMPFSGLAVGQGWRDPALTVSLTAGKLDVDRYLPVTKAPTLAEQRAGKKKASEPVDLPLGFLRALRVSGKATLEEFKLARLRTLGLSGVVRAEKGDILVSSLKGKMYGGLLTGEVFGKVEAKRLATGTKLHVEKAQAGPMMLDLAKREYVVGAADLDLDLTSAGATDDDIVANLEGECRAVVRNGSFKFSGFEDQGVETGKLSADTKENSMVATDPKRRRTSFDKASASFIVHKGVFTVDPFLLESPLLNSSGKGWFSLPANEIDFSVKNDFVAVPGVTIDVVGKLTDPEVRVPKGKILDNTVRNILSLPQRSFKFLRDLFM